MSDCKHVWKVGDRFRRLKTYSGGPAGSKIRYPTGAYGVVKTVTGYTIRDVDLNVEHNIDNIEYAPMTIEDEIVAAEQALEALREAKRLKDQPKIEVGQTWTYPDGTYRIIAFEPELGNTPVVFLFTSANTGVKKVVPWSVASIHSQLKLVNKPCEC